MAAPHAVEEERLDAPLQALVRFVEMASLEELIDWLAWDTGH